MTDMNRKCLPQAVIFCEHTHTYTPTLTQDTLWPGKGVFIQAYYTDAPFVPDIVLGTEPWQWPGEMRMMAWTCWVSTGDAGFCQGHWRDSSQGLMAELSPEEHVWWVHWRTDPLQRDEVTSWIDDLATVLSLRRKHTMQLSSDRDQSKQSGWTPGGFSGNVSV